MGARIKSGYAIAVLVTCSNGRYSVVRRESVALSTDEVPDSRFPYHPALELPEKKGSGVTQLAIAAVKTTARREMAALLDGLPTLCGAGLVVGSMAEPDTISNPHIRAHAQEGKLFREVVAGAITGRGLDHAVLLERDAYENVATELACDSQKLRSEIDQLGKGAITPWRAEEKLAALAGYWCLRRREALTIAAIAASPLP